MTVRPGELLAELLDEWNLSVNVASVAMRCTPSELQGVLDGKRRITPKIAQGLADTLGCSAMFWVTFDKRAREANR